MSYDIFSSTSRQSIEKVWSKGDKCQVRWQVDEQIYKGRIKQIRRCCDTNKTFALVAFQDFGAEDDEEFDVSELQELKSEPSPIRRKSKCKEQGLFLPLTGEEQDRRIEDKYGLDVHEDFTDMSTASENQEKITPRTSTRNKTKISNQLKISTRETVSSTSCKPNDIDRERHSSTIDCNDEGAEFSGFNEDDLEKPKFSFKPSAAKIPFILSRGIEKPLVQVPASINQHLRDYQRDGIRFLYDHYKIKKGAILGDDMGLGKTVQVIALLAALLNKQGNKVDILKHKPSFIKKLSNTKYLKEEPSSSPFLIIGPGSVLYNWLDELETWGYFSISKYHGVDKEFCLSEVEKGKIEIVVTTFETFRDNLREMCRIDWQAVIVDEVHRIKDSKSLTTKALLKIPTALRYGLTGTALQNNMTELWTILDWAQPGVLGSKYDFTEEFVKPIERGQRTDATKRELAEARKRKEKFSEIRKKMMLRRMKTLISDQLPDKDDNVVFCKLSHLQTTVYKAILNHPDLELILKMDDPCSCGSDKSRARCCFKEAQDGFTVKGLKFSFMHLLMKVANHVALLVPREDTSKLQTLRAAEICDLALKDHQEFISLTKEATFRTLSDPKYCGKMKILQGLLQVFYKTHSKVLIFSLSTKLLDILEQYVISTCYEFRRLDGSVSNKRRMELVREFNKNPNIFIFLISTKAGGLGLNLTGANRVVIFDPNWNPSHDLQAQDRAYRIGQRQNVQVYRLISAGTIEENIYLRQIYKQQLGNVVVSSQNAKRLFHGVQGNKNKHGELFGLKNMFQLRTGESCLTMDIIERNAKVEAGLNGFDMTKYIPSAYETQNSSVETDDDLTDDKKSESSTDSDGFTEFFNSNEEDDVDGSLNQKSSVNNLTLTSAISLKSETNLKSSLSVQSVCESSKCTAGPSGLVTEPTCNKQVAGSTCNKQVAGSTCNKRVAGSSKAGVSKPYKKVISQQHLRKQTSKTDELTDQSYSSVGDVLGQSGVLHVHKNIKVIGTSKAENHMTRCALQEVYELHQNSQVPAAQCDPLSEPSSDEDQLVLPKKKIRKMSFKIKDHNTPKALQHNMTKILIGQTPTAIRRKQFEKICEFRDGKSMLDVAEDIIRGNTEYRLELLKSFYVDQHPEHGEIINNFTTLVPSDDQSYCTTSSSKKDNASKSCRKSLNKKSTQHSKSRTVGVSFLDSSLSDSETQHSSPQNASLSDHYAQESSLDVGMKPSPLHKRRLQQSKNKCVKSSKLNITKTLDCAGPSSTATLDGPLPESANIIGPTWLQADGILYDNMVVISKTSDETTSVKHNQPLQKNKNESKTNIDPVSELIQEMATDSVVEPNLSIDLQVEKPATNNMKSKPCKGDYKSVLDDFFMDDESKTSPVKLSKCPDNNATQKISKYKKRSTDDLFADFDMNSCESTSNSDYDDKYDLLNNSTLKDDNVDCFTDPRRWKKRSKLSVSKTVDKLLRESDDDYEKLFKCGKLKKRTPPSSEEFNIDESPNLVDQYKTPSLFS